ncbi:MAG: NAD(P)/FAD-dependent oxidoreductase, partial [Verrucomicrobiota bacterium]
MNYDVIVIGGGAAGLMCAIEAGKRGRHVLVLELAERLAKKILISGGGRCNFTNLEVSAQNYVTSGSPHFCKSALARFTPADFIALVEKHGISYHEKKLGQLFCDLSSKQIVEMLETECAAAKVEIRLNCRVADVRMNGRFEVETNFGAFTSDSLVVATGGLSFPKLGATDLGYRLADKFGLKMVPRLPGLVPFVFAEKERGLFVGLSGLSLDVIATVPGAKFRENILFTHRGASGPVVLQISNYYRPHDSIRINLLPDKSARELFAQHRSDKKELATVLSQCLPQRFAQAWCEQNAPSRPMNRFTPRELESIAAHLHSWEIRPCGDEGYGKAEVTRGGLDTNELSSKTMEARRVPGLFFVGEVIDVTGWLGGFNFQWAWAS